MTDKLKSCPFCGGNNIGVTYVETYSVDSSYETFGCKSCGIGIDQYDAKSPQQELNEWNKRTVPEGYTLVKTEFLYEISSMCVGALTLSIPLDAQYIGSEIYNATGMTQPELAKSAKEAQCKQ